MEPEIVRQWVAQPWAVSWEYIYAMQMHVARKLRGVKINARSTRAQTRRPRVAPPGGVGIVPIHGILTQRPGFWVEMGFETSTELLGRQIDEFAADPAVKAIILDVDSPGGGVWGTPELADKIWKVGKDKKIIGVVNSLAASGAYYLASQATELVMTPGGEVGSIGVYRLHIDVSEADKMMGVKVEAIFAGERKLSGASGLPLDDMGREELQREVSDYYEKFVKAVARGRGKSASTVREGFGRGGLVRADQALAEGMIDKIATFESVIARFGLSTAEAMPLANAQPDPAIEIRKRKLLLD